MRTVSQIILAALLFAAPLAAKAEPVDFTEKLDIGISTDEIAITSDFRGADLTIFGAIDGADPGLLAQGKYNIVVALEGPEGKHHGAQEGARLRHLDQHQFDDLRKGAGILFAVEHARYRHDSHPQAT